MGNSQSTQLRPSKPTRLDLYHSPSAPDLSITEKSKETVAYAPNAKVDTDESTVAYQAFLKVFPEYQLTWILDTLRRTDYARLDRAGETYVDYMGAALYPESLIRVHAGFLNNNVLGNTHSISNR
jgi:molybdenum cofactor sulfurtransferase